MIRQVESVDYSLKKTPVIWLSALYLHDTNSMSPLYYIEKNYFQPR